MPRRGRRRVASAAEGFCVGAQGVLCVLQALCAGGRTVATAASLVLVGQCKRGGTSCAGEVAQRKPQRAWSSVFSSSAKEQSVCAPPSRTIASRFTAHSESETNAHAE